MTGNDVTVGQIAGTQRNLVFPKDSRDKHLYVCGATGTGKSKFLENLIRQDIQARYEGRSGLLLLDPHGSLYDSLVSWLASADVVKLPIILIDLRNGDWVVSYNSLRRRESADCSVLIRNFVQSLAYVWGESGTDRMPRLERWVSTILHTLYENQMTVLEAEYLLDYQDREARATLTANLQDQISKKDWENASKLNAQAFDTELSSTANRLRRFLRNQRMRSIFGQGGVSLDLRKALDEGYIILVSLACAGGKVAEEDADLFATLLLSDLWNAALVRGKDTGDPPFYLYLDEFQCFICPSIARNLDQARGFGLHLTVANQYPKQLLSHGEIGESLYQSILENATNKAVFRLHSEENLRPMAQILFQRVMNPDEVKHTLEATKVMGYREETRVSRTTGGSRTSAITRTEGSTEVESFGESHGNSEGAGTQYRLEEYKEDLPLARNEASGSSDGVSSGRATGRQESTAASVGETESFSETVGTVLIPILGKEISQVQFRSLEEQLQRAMAALNDQEQREGVVLLEGMRAPVSVKTPTVKRSLLEKKRLKAYVAKVMKKWKFAMPAKKAALALEAREKQVELQLRPSLGAGQPQSYRRRVTP